MDHLKALESFKTIVKELEQMHALAALVGWDDWMGLPEKGIDFRDETRAYLENKRLDLIKSQELTEAIEELTQDEPSLNLVDRAVLREVKREKRMAECLPQERLVAFEAVKATAQRVWQEAHHTSNYALFKPYLKQVIEFNRELSLALSGEGHILDPLMDILDPGATVVITDRVFEDLKRGLVDLLKDIRKSEKVVNEDFLNFEFDERQLASFCQKLVETLGYDPIAGGYAKTLHPFTSSLGPVDARITTNYSCFTAGLFALIHEAGHGMYAQGGGKEAMESSLWGGLNGAMHESQSRLYENIIGRSYSFWKYYFPILQEALPHFENVSLDTFYSAINAVKSSLIRVQADEVTYSLHVIIRYELEKRLLEEDLSVDDLPEAWNNAYEAYLGIRPSNDREGVLQDVHWSCGYFGYFQSYSLGNMYSAQIFDAMKADLGSVDEMVARGEFVGIREWLRAKIHQYGGIYTPVELIVKATGRPLEASHYLNYLSEKYHKLYN